MNKTYFYMKYNEDEILKVKYIWRRKQLTKVSNSAIIYGPRESARHFWNFILEDNDDKEEEEKVNKTGIFSRIKHFFKKMYK